MTRIRIYIYIYMYVCISQTVWFLNSDFSWAQLLNNPQHPKYLHNKGSSVAQTILFEVFQTYKLWNMRSFVLVDVQNKVSSSRRGLAEKTKRGLPLARLLTGAQRGIEGNHVMSYAFRTKSTKWGPYTMSSLIPKLEAYGPQAVQGR